MGLLDDNGAGLLLQHAAAFRHLESIDVSQSYLTGDVIAQLAKTFKKVEANEQKEPEDDYRYCAIGE
jgi:hypothetical protein